MSEYKLSQGIIELSEASNWDKAKLEWSLDSIYKEEEPDTCLCGHFPIIEICILKNRLNANTAVVGKLLRKRNLSAFLQTKYFKPSSVFAATTPNHSMRKPSTTLFEING